MDDNDVSDDRPVDGGAVEELSVGGWQAGDGSRHRWRRRIGFGLAFCLVFALGAAGAYAWMQQRQRDQPRIAATLAETQPSQARQGRVPVGIQLHNQGKHAVTLEKVRLSRSGFTVSSGGLDGTEKLSPQDSTEISYKLSPDCDTSVQGPATVRVRVRASDGSRHWITDTVPQAPPDVVGFGLTVSQFERCSTVGELGLSTRRASTTHDTLTLHVRLHVRAHAGGEDPPRGVRLRKLSVEGDAPAIRASFTPAGSDRSPRSIPVPARGTVRIRVKHTDCYAPPEPISLRASVTRKGRTGQADVGYDAKTAARILNFTAKRCG